MKSKSPTVAFFLNLFFPGLGFAYIGTPALMFGGGLIFAVSIWESLKMAMRFTSTDLLLGIVTAVAFAILAQEVTGISNRATPETRQCPHCAEQIKTEATVCKHCGREASAPSAAYPKARL